MLDNVGVHGGLELLKQRVLHRFTALYKLGRLVVRNVDLVDKAGLLGLSDLSDLKDVPLRDSFFFHFVRRDGKFLTDDSEMNPRLEGHKCRDLMRSYVGLPVRCNSGALWGTFCHSDLVPQALAAGEFDFLHQALRLLPPYLG